MAQNQYFVSRYATTTNEDPTNSLKAAIMLDEAKQVEADLATQVSDANASRVEFNATQVSSSLLTTALFALPGTEDEQISVEHLIEKHKIPTLLRALGSITTVEELEELISTYEQTLGNIERKLTSLKNEKLLKTYLAIKAALNLLHQHAKQPDLQLGSKLVEQLKSSLISIKDLLLAQAQQLQSQIAERKAAQPNTSLLAKQMLEVLSKVNQTQQRSIENLQFPLQKQQPSQLLQQQQQVQHTRQVAVMAQKNLQTHQIQSNNVALPQQAQRTTQHIQNELYVQQHQQPQQIQAIQKEATKHVSLDNQHHASVQQHTSSRSTPITQSVVTSIIQAKQHQLATLTTSDTAPYQTNITSSSSSIQSNSQIPVNNTSQSGEAQRSAMQNGTPQPSTTLGQVTTNYTTSIQQQQLQQGKAEADQATCRCR